VLVSDTQGKQEIALEVHRKAAITAELSGKNMN
jgi:hypothetical protein